MTITRRVFVASLVFAALVSTRDWHDIVEAETAQCPTPELPAMIVTPTDLGFAGMASNPVDHLDGKLQSAEEIAEEYTIAKGVPAKRANEAFIESGLQRRYWHQYVLNYPGDPIENGVYRRVTTSVYEFKDASSAAAAFDPLSRLLAWDAPAVNAGIVPIGEDMRLSRAEVPYENGPGTYPEMTLTFRTGQFIGSVSISEDLGEPGIAAVETLATQLLEHIRGVVAGGEPDLSARIPRLSDLDVLQDNYDGYTLIGGGVIAGSANSDDVAKTIEATAAAGAGALDGYKLSFYLVAGDDLSVTDFGTMLYRFFDEGQASDWIDALPDRLYASPAPHLQFSVAPSIDAPSFIATYEGDHDDSVQHHQIAAVQAGPYVAIMYGPEMEPDTTSDYLTVQLDYIGADSCVASFRESSSIRGDSLTT